MANYITNNNPIIAYGELVLDVDQIVESIIYANNALVTLDRESKKFDIDIFEALGMRNLSGLIGEFFAKSVQRHSNSKLVSNLHQDGYPDLLLVNTPDKKKYFDTLYTVKTNKKTVQRKLSQVPSRWLRLFPIRFTINRLIINIMTSNFGTTGTRAHLYEFPDQDLQSL